MGGLIGFVLVTLAGLVFGRVNEANHYKQLAIAEAQLSDILTLSVKTLLENITGEGALVSGNVVVANDAFKKLLSSLNMFFGGRVKVYESLMERARRQAVVRMKEKAQAMGAHTVTNVRLETSTIMGKAYQVGSIEVLAYGTAIK